MSADQIYDAEFRQTVLTALGDVLGSGVIGERSRLRRLLRYLVTEELEGRGAQINAFSIGVDVFGRGKDFDPNSDSIVRVEINRLRQSLAQYYSGAGAGATLRTQAPPRTYRPRLERVAPAPPAAGTGTDGDAPPPETPVPEAAPPRPRTHRRRFALVAIAAAMLGAIGAFAASTLFDLAIIAPPPIEPVGALPVVNVEPFVANADAFEPLATSVREQLIANLAHLGTVQVRAEPARQTQAAQRDGPEQYVISGVADRSNGLAILALRLTSARDGVVLWSRSLEVAATDATLERDMLDAVGAASIELGGERGMVTMDALRRLMRKLDADPDAGLSEYECLLIAYMFDSTKYANARARARACLEQAVAADSDSGAVWAQLALALFLEWAQGDAEDVQLERALRAARRAVQLAPYNATAHEHLGSILSALSDLEGAIASFRRGLALAPFKPSLRFALGWQMALRGDWDGGVELIRGAIEMSPAAPGFMRIPIAIDAFRRHDYAESIRIATEIAQLGDGRGLQLAFGAAAASGDLDLARNFLDQLRQQDSFDPVDPFRGVRNSFSSPQIMLDYDRAAWTSGLL